MKSSARLSQTKAEGVRILPTGSISCLSILSE